MPNSVQPDCWANLPNSITAFGTHTGLLPQVEVSRIEGMPSLRYSRFAKQYSAPYVRT